MLVKYALIVDNVVVQELDPNEAFVSNGIRHSPGWLSTVKEEDLASHGIKKVELPPEPNTDLYDIIGHTPVVLDNRGIPRKEYILIPKDLKPVKQAVINKIKAAADEKLRATDWQIVRQMETSVKAHPRVLSTRAAIRDKVAKAETAILDAKDPETIATIMSKLEL